MKKATKLIAPVLFLFVLLQHSGYVLPLVLELSSTVVDKNYMFILCNGILVLIAKSSGLMGSKGEKKKKEKKEKEVAEVKLEMEDKEPELEEEVVSEGGREEKEEEKDCSFLTEEEEEEEEVVEKHTDGGDSSHGVVEEEEGFEEEEEEEEEEGKGLLSAEELQRKCEDFIRKMKAGIKFEAQQHQQQQQLIMVQ